MRIAHYECAHANDANIIKIKFVDSYVIRRLASL